MSVCLPCDTKRLKKEEENRQYRGCFDDHDSDAIGTGARAKGGNGQILSDLLKAAFEFVGWGKRPWRKNCLQHLTRQCRSR